MGATWLRQMLLVGGLVAFFAGAATAQVTTGTVDGTVVDESEKVIPGATVTLVHEQTGAARVAVSNEEGAFTFNAVLPGVYTVRVELQGFRTFEQRGNVLNASSRLSLGNVTLGVGAVTETVTVEATGSQVETRNSDYSGLLTSTQLARIQTRGRDVMNLLRLLPGVRQEEDIEAMGDSFGSNVPNVSGQRRAWNQVTVDGLNGNELSGTSRFSSAINLDAIAEVKVLLNTYKAEYGRTGGANIAIVSKGGGQTYNGSAYWYGRRDEWNANRWENIRAGTPKPEQHIDTYGANVGGPLRIPGLFGNGGDKKVFFFYSLEAPQVQRPGPERRYRMPTELERRGDFSQTRESNGALVVIRDPLTGQPFPGNIIPANRLDPNGQRLLDLLPTPNALNHAATAQWNFTRTETSDNPRWNNLLRIDVKPSGADNFWGVLRTFNSDQIGSEITAAPARWGFFSARYIFSDSSVNFGWTNVRGSNMVNEIQGGIRRQTEGFETADDAQRAKFRRPDLGLTLGQFHPELNPDNVMPQVNFGLAATGIESPDFTFDQRLGQTAADYLTSIRHTLTYTRGSHSFKAGGYVEYMRNNEARGGLWMGQIQFNNNSANPLNTNHAFSNALLGVFNQYSETDRHRETKNRAWMAEWFAQDTWQATPRFTLDYGARFLWYRPYWREDEQVANFIPVRYDPARAPLLYVPTLVNGQRQALNPVTGQVLPPVYIGAYVPGTGDPTNGMLLQTDPDAPKGLREHLAPEIEPRIGFAWDATGDGKTSVRASTGVFHNARLGGGSLGNLSGNPPFINVAVVHYLTLAQLFQPGALLTLRPATVEALEFEAKTPYAINYSASIQREIGWDTTVEIGYLGTRGRHLEMYTNINPIADGARYLDLNPQNRDISNNQPLPNEFLRPYRGFQEIRLRENWGQSRYDSLQIQVNRRYTRGFQMGGAYTYAKATGVADEDPGNLTYIASRPVSYFESRLGTVPTHALVVNYTWDIPDSGATNAFVRGVIDGWQLSGSNQFVDGELAPVMFTTTDNFDFTGGEGGQGTDLGGGFRSTRPDLVGDPKLDNPDPLTGYFNTAAFARPSGRGDFGDAPRNVVEKPGVINWNLAAFKNFGLGGRRSAQVRVEVYNVLNTNQFSDINRTARFDATGRQIDPTFGIATATRAPRQMQLSFRFSF